jgi:hypothetical protein
MLVQKFDPTIKLTNYSVQLTEKNARQIEQKELIGWNPYIQYRNMSLENNQIVYFKLSSIGILPELELILTDDVSKLKTDFFALDNDIISVYLNSRTNSLTDIKMDFVITDYNYDRKTDLIYIKAITNLNLLQIQFQHAYRNMTSYDVLSEISKKLGLGFVSNFESTNDEMTWINPRTGLERFIRDVTIHSYKDEQSFFWSFIDFYYNFNFINVEQEMEELASKTYGLIDAGISLFTTGKDPDNAVTPLTLTYSKDPEKYSNTSILEYEVYNQSTKKSFETGYKKNISFYNKLLNYNKGAGGWLDFNIDTSRSDTAVKDNIVLKDMPGAQSSFYEYNIRYHYLGKLDSDNVHQNFLIAYVQNLFNISELQKIYIIVKLAMPNYAIQRFTKLKLMLMDDSATDNKIFLNTRLSGAYIVTGVIFEIDDNTFVQKLILCKRELTKENLDI